MMAGAEIFSVLDSRIPDEQGGARLGRLNLRGRNSIDTPNFLAVTSRGVVPHLTPDVVREHTQFGGVHLALEDYVEKASTDGTPPIMNCPSLNSTPLHTFTAIPSSLATILAPRRIPAVSAPNGNSDDAISIFTSVGFQSLSVSAYTWYVQKLRPDIAIALGDVPYGTLPGSKRVAKMGDRTLAWLESLLSAPENESSDGGSNGPTAKPAIFAPILPIEFHTQWEYLHGIADDLAHSISGLAFYSSALLPDVPATTALSRLPRLSLDEPVSPHHILRQISLGMDLFALPFIGTATDAGLALSFCFPCPAAANPDPDHEPAPDGADDDDGPGPENGGSQRSAPASRIQPLAIDLSSREHATSLSPLQPGCACYTCATHHRAFVQHLLSATEMLGWALLAIHNHAAVACFFGAVRASIDAGRFETDRAVFACVYEPDLPTGMAQRPRARGYHFKSEGPAEKKRNSPAWGPLGDGEPDADADREVGLRLDGNLIALEGEVGIERRSHVVSTRLLRG